MDWLKKKKKQKQHKYKTKQNKKTFKAKTWSSKLPNTTSLRFYDAFALFWFDCMYTVFPMALIQLLP